MLEGVNTQTTWDANADIVMKGQHFEQLCNFFNQFRMSMLGLDATMQNNVTSGVIQVKYFDNDKNELSEEVVKQMFETINQQPKMEIVK